MSICETLRNEISEQSKYWIFRLRCCPASSRDIFSRTEPFPFETDSGDLIQYMFSTDYCPYKDPEIDVNNIHGD